MATDPFQPGIDPRQGVTLADAVLWYGGLARPRMHWATRTKLEWRKRDLLDLGPLSEEKLVAYVDAELDGRKIVSDKLLSGDVLSKGIVRAPGSSVSDGLIDIHREQYRVLVLDWEGSSASSPAGLVIEGILVFPSTAAQPGVGDDRKLYDRARSYLHEHWQNLRPDKTGFGRNEIMKRVAKAVGCSQSTVRNVLNAEGGKRGLLVGHQWRR